MNTFIFDCEVFAHDWLFVFKENALKQTLAYARQIYEK